MLEYVRPIRKGGRKDPSCIRGQQGSQLCPVELQGFQLYQGVQQGFQPCLGDWQSSWSGLSPYRAKELNLYKLIMKLELCRRASDYAKPSLVLLKHVWKDGYLECQAGSLIPILDPTVWLFTCIAGLAQSLAIHINWRSTFPAQSYSCYWPGYGYLMGYSIKGES